MSIRKLASLGSCALICLILAGLPAYLTGCGQAPSETSVTYKFAYVGSFFYPSGMPALWGMNSQDAVMLAVQDANREGWCGPGCQLSLPPSLIFQANGTSTPELKAFLKKALDSGVAAIVGADWTRLAADVYAELQSAGASVPFISAGATAVQLGNATEYPNFIRSVYSDADGVHDLLGNLVARAAVTPQTNGTSPDHVVLLFSREPFGEGGAVVVESSAATGGPVLLAKAGFPPNATLAEVSAKVKELMATIALPSSQSVLKGRQPMFMISAIGPDTTTSMLALGAEGIAGPPAGGWIVGATEAPESVIHSRKEAWLAAGYNSYLPEHPASGLCPTTDDFDARFQKQFGRAPSGGFSASSYDSIVLLSSLVKISRSLGAALPHASPMLAALQRLRSSGAGPQGLTGPLVFLDGENQPCRPAVIVNQLSATGDTLPVASSLAHAEAVCPSQAVGSQVTSAACPSSSGSEPALRFVCDPKLQNANKCDAAHAAYHERAARQVHVI